MDKAPGSHPESPGSSPFKTLRFSTDDFPVAKQLEAYREIFGGTIVRHDIEPIGDGPFHFEANMCSLPGLGWSSGLISPCKRWHGPQHLDRDDLILGIGLSGGCMVRQRGREVIVGTGEGVLTSSAHTADVLIAATSRPVSLRLPFAILRERITDLEDRIATRVPRDAEGLALLTRYIDALCEADLTSDDLRKIAVGHVYDLVSLILGAKGDVRHAAEEGGLRAARRFAILREIENRSGDPSLSAVAVALRLGITPRYVHLVLEETGKSFTLHLLERRLERAATMLRDPRWRYQKIADIAAEAGFTDLSYFNRAFRRRYGGTPSDIRAAAPRET